MDQAGGISKKASISEDVYSEIPSELRLPIKARPLTPDLNVSPHIDSTQRLT